MNRKTMKMLVTGKKPRHAPKDVRVKAHRQWPVWDQSDGVTCSVCGEDATLCSHLDMTECYNEMREIILTRLGVPSYVWSPPDEQLISRLRLQG